MKRVLILGSTGSIGTQALDVIERSPDAFEVVGLSAGRSHEQLVAQAKKYNVRRIALSDKDAAARAGEFAGRMKVGDVVHDPPGGECPPWCRWHGVCRVANP